MTINNQTQFVISYIIPGKSDTINNGNKTTNQEQQQKQFQKKYSHLFHVSMMNNRECGWRWGLSDKTESPFVYYLKCLFLR